jgi:predicted esterase
LSKKPDSVRIARWREKMKTAKYYLLFFLALFWTFPPLAQQSQEHQIFQTDKKIVIDGNLDEWTNFEELLIDLMPDGKKLAPSPDLTVAARLTFDAENFYVAVRAIDDQPEFPERGRRPGFSERGARPEFAERGGQPEFAERGRRQSDEFWLTFIDSSPENESDRFLTLGFTMRGSEAVTTVINRNGESLPQSPIGDIQSKIVVDSEQKSVVYEAAIPWKYLPFFRPFLQKKCGINLIYIDYDKEKRTVVQLLADPGYDSHMSRKREGPVFHFIPHTPEVPEFESLLDVDHFYQDQEKKINLAINSPSDFQGWEVRFILSSRSGNTSSKKSLSFTKGLNVLGFVIDTENQPSGLYDLSLGVLDDRGALRFSDDAQFFLLNKKEFESLESKLAEVKKGELFLKDAVFRDSLPTLEIRLQWIKKLMDDPAPFVDLQSLREWNQDMEDLIEEVDKGKPALFPPGRPVRLAYRSEIDNTLQPYSVLIPDNYDQKKPWPLLVTLHDAGADDRRALAGISFPYYGPRKKGSGVNFIVLAPLARGLSDWYVGESAREVIECISQFKKLYNVDEKRMAIDGFYMGGYGAWRIALLHPDMFKAVVVRSGRISPPDSVKGENILDLLDRGGALDFLIIHGGKDEFAPVEDIRKAAARMEELKIRVKYIEVRGAGHGDYNKWPDILEWLKDVIGK